MRPRCSLFAGSVMLGPCIVKVLPAPVWPLRHQIPSPPEAAAFSYTSHLLPAVVGC